MLASRGLAGNDHVDGDKSASSGMIDVGAEVSRISKVLRVVDVPRNGITLLAVVGLSDDPAWPTGLRGSRKSTHRATEEQQISDEFHGCA